MVPLGFFQIPLGHVGGTLVAEKPEPLNANALHPSTLRLKSLTSWFVKHQGMAPYSSSYAIPYRSESLGSYEELRRDYIGDITTYYELMYTGNLNPNTRGHYKSL